MQELPVEKQIYSVSALNKSVKKLLENHFQIIWIEGEISNLSRPSSGHIYFTLKDETAQVRCAQFRLRNFSRAIFLENGMHILATAKISLYDARGDYQLIIEHIEERGEGLLRRRYEQLKNKLAGEGLFDLHQKKSLPKIPRCVGIITSPTGAAIADVLSVLQRRFPSLPVIIYPTQVQGEQAPAQICRAIQMANEAQHCDVLILCRGGGSLEDLWCFNDEQVARTIFQCTIPIISGIGHEVDFTIADFVADHRAATPSAAAESVSPDMQEYLQTITHLKQRCYYLISSLIQQHQKNIMTCLHYFSKPERLLIEHAQRIDALENQLHQATLRNMEQYKNHLQLTQMKLVHSSPTQKLAAQKSLIANYHKTLTLLCKQHLQQSQQQLANATRMLQSISPLPTLERGYSIARHDDHLVDSVTKVQPGDTLKIEVRDGYIDCTVDSVVPRD